MTVSSLRGIRKKTEWDMWKTMAIIWTVFQNLLNIHSQITDEEMEELECFSVLRYNKTPAMNNVNEA